MTVNIDCRKEIARTGVLIHDFKKQSGYYHRC